MGVCTEKDNIALVMEYVEGKSLDRILHDPKIPLSIQQQMHIAKNIAKGRSLLSLVTRKR
jgi:serine/threonine protein kinase